MKLVPIFEESLDGSPLDKYKIVFKDRAGEMTNETKPKPRYKDLILIDKETKEETVICTVERDSERYSTDPRSRVANAIRNVYPREWNSEKLASMFDLDKDKLRSSTRSVASSKLPALKDMIVYLNELISRNKKA